MEPKGAPNYLYSIGVLGSPGNTGFQPAAGTAVAGTGASITLVTAVDPGTGLAARNISPTADGLSTAAIVAMEVANFSYTFNGTTYDRTRALLSSTDAQTAAQVGLPGGVVRLQGFNGDTFDRVRVANVFKSIAFTAAGDNAVWTPAGGKKFRLMGGTISASGVAASLVADLLKLLDGSGGATIAQFMIAVNTTVTGDTQITFSCGNGYLSAAANNVLTANLATALTDGHVCVNVYGTEE